MRIECNRRLPMMGIAAVLFGRLLAGAEPVSEAIRHYEAGLEARRNGDNRRAAAELETAVAKGFRNLGARVHLLEAYFASRHFVAGGKLAAELIDSGIRSPQVLFRIGQTLFQNTNYREAARAFRSSLDLDANGEARYFLALSQFLLEDWAASIATLEPLARLPEAAALRASARASAGNLDQAEQDLQALVRQAPSSPHAYINLALIRLEQERPTEALEALAILRQAKVQGSPKVFYAVRRKSCDALVKEALAPPDAADADFAAYLLDLATQMQNRFHHGSAVELLRLATRRANVSAKLLEAGGASCLNLDQVPAALSLLERAVASGPASAALLGRSKLRAGDPAGAVKAFRLAVGIHPDAASWAGLGQALVAAGQTEPAIHALRSALSLDPNHPVAMLELGRLQTRSGELVEAESLLRRAIDVEPDFYEAHYALSLLLARAGKSDEARRSMMRFQEKKAAIGQLPAVQSGFISEERR